MMVMCNGIVIIEYDRRRSGLPNAPLDMEYYNNVTERWSSLHLNITSIITYCQCRSLMSCQFVWTYAAFLRPVVYVVYDVNV